eukprot:1148000-Pelagomonas_calceolata.AAC.9
MHDLLNLAHTHVVHFLLRSPQPRRVVRHHAPPTTSRRDHGHRLTHAALKQHASSSDTTCNGSGVGNGSDAGHPSGVGPHDDAGANGSVQASDVMGGCKRLIFWMSDVMGGCLKLLGASLWCYGSVSGVMAGCNHLILRLEGASDV